MKQLIFATHNQNKCDEVSSIIGNEFEIKSLSDLGINCDIPETGKTFKENALQKAMFVYNKFGYECFADDSGLCVEVLNGEPGIYSARYAGEPSDMNRNISKLLFKLKGKENRNAYFTTIIAAIIEGKEYFFEGKIYGKIIDCPHGNNGFGYDPIFVPNGYNKTFAELSSNVKNKISHRALAIKQFSEFLKDKQY